MQSAPCSAVLVCQLSRPTEQGKPVRSLLVAGSRALQQAAAVCCSTRCQMQGKQPTCTQAASAISIDLLIEQDHR